jgi:threonyl-tRNA synthetase
VRASLDHRPEKIGSKIRDAQNDKIPVMLVVGAKEAENQAVAYRDRTKGDLGAMPLASALTRLREQMEIRTVEPVAPPAAPDPSQDENEQHTY